MNFEHMPELDGRSGIRSRSRSWSRSASRSTSSSSSGAGSSAASVARGDHDVGGLDHGDDLGALGEAELLRRLRRDRRDEGLPAHVEVDDRGRRALGRRGDAGVELVASAELHGR